MIFDKTVAIKQLNVVEAHGLLIFREEKKEELFQLGVFCKKNSKSRLLIKFLNQNLMNIEFLI